MDINQRGGLFLQVAPKGKVEKAVISYLLSLRQDSSLEVLAAKVRKAPTILFTDISVKRAFKIAADLRELGAYAEFVPYRNEGPSTTKPHFTKASSPPRSKKGQAHAFTKPKRRKWARLIFLLILLLISMGLLIVEYYPYLVYFYNHYFPFN